MTGTKARKSKAIAERLLKPAPATEQGAYRLIRHGAIQPSRDNPRKHFDEDQLQELANSIKEVGVLEPILVREMNVRPAPGKQGGKPGWLLELYDDQGKAVAFADQVLYKTEGDAQAVLPLYELVAGERRWRACEQVGLPLIPCIVRPYTDRQADEIRIVENMQRADLDPVEEADGYQKLIDRHQYTPETVAARISKSTSYVYGRLKLGTDRLPAEAANAIRQGRLTVNHGILIGRLPNDKLREKATSAFLHPAGYGYEYRPELRGMPLTFRDAKQLIEQDYMVELKGAPFDRKSLTVLPEAGSCDACPKRTGNAREEYPESRADVCTDPECYRKKVAAHLKAAKERIVEKGGQVLPAGEAKKALRDYGSEWVRLDKAESYGRGAKTRNQVLGAKLDDVKDEVRVAFDDRGKPVKVLPKEVYDQAVGKKASSNGNGRKHEEDWQARQRREREHFQALRSRFQRAVYDKVLTDDMGTLHAAVRHAIDSPVEWEQVQPLVAQLAEENGRQVQSLQELIDLPLSKAEAVALLVVIVFDGNYYQLEGRGLSDRCKLLGLDAKQLRKDAAADLKAKAKAEKAILVSKSTTVGQCRVCGCTADDCMGCVERTGEPCEWVEPDLCSACQEAKLRPSCRRCGAIKPMDPHEGLAAWELAKLYKSTQIPDDVRHKARVTPGRYLCGECVTIILDGGDPI